MRDDHRPTWKPAAGIALGLALGIALGFGLPRLTPAGDGMGGRSASDAGDDAISDACGAPAFRAFDYWLGEWRVRDAEGEVVGRNTIERVASGCGLLERWRGATGSYGISLNLYDPATDEWRQYWVGGGGLILRLEGGLDADSVMTMTGERATEDGGRMIDRIRWIPRPDGRVEQYWDASDDGGRSWEPVFRGFYERR